MSDPNRYRLRFRGCRLLHRITTAGLAILLGTAGVAASQETHGAVSGIVIDARTEIPLPRTLVVMTGVGETTTDDAGRFRISNVPSGRHNLQAVRTGMAALVADRSSGITIAPGEEVRNVRLRLSPFGVLSGRIRDDQGNPLSGVSVQALVVSYEQGRRFLVAPSLTGRILNSSTETDDNGAYRLDLPPGVYYVCAQFRVSNVSRDGAARVLGGAPKTCYPGTPDAALAATVALTGGEASGIDFNLAASAEGLHKIYVRLEGAGQALLNAMPAGAQIGELRDRFSLQSIPILSPTRRGMGSTSQGLVIDGVPDGSYDLFVDGVIQGGGRGRGTTSIQMRGEDLHDVVITLLPGQNIFGRVVGADPMKPISLSGLTLGLGSRSTSVEATGMFVVSEVLSGFYAVTVDGLPPEGYVADIRYGGTSLYDTASSLNGPELEVGISGASLQIVVATNGGAVDGVVDGRESAAGATVVLIPPVSRRFVQSYYKATTANPTGAFSFEGVPPGVYQLFAWERVPETAWLNPEFMSRWEGQGQTIVIEAGGGVNVRTRLLSGEN